VRAIGVGDPTIIFRHIPPNTLAPMSFDKTSFDSLGIVRNPRATAANRA
jgi:hypothetical protein